LIYLLAKKCLHLVLGKALIELPISTFEVKNVLLCNTRSIDGASLQVQDLIMNRITGELQTNMQLDNMQG